MTNGAMPVTVTSREQALGGLRGAWQFSRVISGSAAASVQGHATFTLQQADLMLYEEQGSVLLDTGQSLVARQSYLYQFTDLGFKVYFDETLRRLFHEVSLCEHAGQLSGRGHHPCGQDTYRTNYTFDLAVNLFRIEHRVTGPRKNYVSKTEYLRQTG